MGERVRGGGSEWSSPPSRQAAPDRVKPDLGRETCPCRLFSGGWQIPQADASGDRPQGAPVAERERRHPRSNWLASPGRRRRAARDGSCSRRCLRWSCSSTYTPTGSAPSSATAGTGAHRKASHGAVWGAHAPLVRTANIPTINGAFLHVRGRR